MKKDAPQLKRGHEDWKHALAGIGSAAGTPTFAMLSHTQPATYASASSVMPNIQSDG